LGASTALTPLAIASEPATPVATIEAPAEKTIKELVEDEFGRGHIMVAVARCESQYRQFNDGAVLRGRVNSKDIGIFQINEGYHLSIAVQKGHDIYTPEGNIAYARYLYDEKGTAPWSASAPCWD
jgi:hypothetical protein